MFPIKPNDVTILINGQSRAIFAHISYSTLLIILGIIIVIFGHSWFPSGDQMKVATSLAGAGVSSLTAFPLRQIVSCYDKITILKLAQTALNDLHTSGKTKKEIALIEEKILSTIQVVIDKII